MATAKSFASVIGGTEIVKYTKEELQSFYGMITEENRQSEIIEPMELTTKTKENTSVYKTYNRKKKQLQQYEETCLGQLLTQIKFLTRGIFMPR